MRKVYEDQDMTMVGYYQSVLQEEGVETAVKNEYAQLAAGEVPFQQVYPELWVVNDEDYEPAVALIKQLREQDAPEVVVGEVDEPEESSEGDDMLNDVPNRYKRSTGMQVVMWLGTMVVVFLLALSLCMLVESLF
ncbi:DUF2007 domain-containing protein [Rubritalea tangerina]|uniref:DUF2007 domain-containing protein n=1 Tax=Rubritalea tangerina TaxID=430798 RepID=A0ABW4ZC62_9BACT